MKTSSHKLYYGTGLSWDYGERLNERWGGNSSWHTKRIGHRPLQRRRQFRSWNKMVRNCAKKGVFDGIDLRRIDFENL